MYCKVPAVLAYIMLAYLIASVYYWIVTRSYGTPFSDALKESGNQELLQIQKESAQKRGQAFLTGMVIAVILLIIFRPFRTCFR